MCVYLFAPSRGQPLCFSLRKKSCLKIIFLHVLLDIFQHNEQKKKKKKKMKIFNLNSIIIRLPTGRTE